MKDETKKQRKLGISIQSIKGVTTESDSPSQAEQPRGIISPGPSELWRDEKP